jgi:Na+/H+ antiporter NhaA
MPFIQHSMELANSILSYLNTPKMLPVIAGAVIGAIFTGVVTLLISYLSSLFKQRGINSMVRGGVTASLQSNKLMCESNLGILTHEIEGMKERRQFTINPLFSFKNSGADLIFSNGKFTRFEVEYLWGNLSGIDLGKPCK